jgi:hypothetical protein
VLENIGREEPGLCHEDVLTLPDAQHLDRLKYHLECNDRYRWLRKPQLTKRQEILDIALFNVPMQLYFGLPDAEILPHVKLLTCGFRDHVYKLLDQKVDPDDIPRIR